MKTVVSAQRASSKTMFQQALPPALAVTALCVVTGALVAVQPRAAVLIAFAAVIAGMLAFRALLVERWALLALISGVMILAQGFANLGLKTGFAPVPLTEFLLVPLVAVALLDRRFRAPSAVLLPLGLFFGILILRLFVDYSTYRSLAVRDTTTGIEAFMMVVGYRALALDGVGPWIKRLRVVGLLVFAYASLYPIRDSLQAWGPTVGLQRAEPLLGNFAGIEPVVAAMLLFFGVFERGVRRALLVGWGLVLIGFLQARGLYLVLFLAAIVLGWLLRRPFKVVVAGVVAVTIAAAGLAVLAGEGVQGRLGPLTSNFYSSQVGTLFGHEGPGAGTIRDRAKWFSETVAYVESSPVYMLVGVGLGPDLTFGFRKGGDVAVRKPHDDYLEVFARTGVVGLFVFLWLLVAGLKPIVRCALRDPGPPGQFCSWVFAACLVFLGISATQPILAFPSGTIPLFFLIGAGLAVAWPALKHAQG